MSRIYKIVLIMMLSGMALFGQTNNVGIGTLTPDNTALLDLFSTTQGFLNVRFTLAQRTALGAPANSLLIYQTDNSDGFWYWDAPDVVWRKWAALKISFLVYGDGTDGQVALWGSSGTLTGVNDLFYDYSDSELGVGTTTPGETLDIAGAIRVGNTTTELPGTIRWTGTDFEGFDGTYWYSFTSTTLTGTGAPGQVTFWTGTNSISGSNDLFVDMTNFNLGIGIGASLPPGEKLTVGGGIIVGNTSITEEGNIRWSGSDFEGYMDGNWVSFTSGTLSGKGADGQVTFWESSTFLSGDFNLFFDYSDTRLGIGTSSPNETLDIDGAMTIGTNTLVAPIEGTVRWNPITNDFEGYIGAVGGWKSFTQSGPFGDGDPTQVAFWLTSRTISGDDNLWWDVPNNRLGVGTNAPSYDLDVVGTLRTGGEGTHGRLNIFSEQGLTDFQLGFIANSSSTASMTFTLPPDDGDNLFILASDGNGELYWGDPFLMLGYYWELIAPDNLVLHTIGDWGISRYGNTLTGNTKTQINFGFLSTTGNAYSSVLGGLNNTSSGSFSTVMGGQINTASGDYSIVPGGYSNIASGNYSYAFGSGNNAVGNFSTISQGQNLLLSGNNSYAFRGGLNSSSYTLTADNTYYILDSRFHFNYNKNNYDFRLDGDNLDNIFFVDASSDRVGINTTTPVQLLDVFNGAIQMSNTNDAASNFIIYEEQGSGDNYSSAKARSQVADLVYTLPTWHNVIHSGLVNNGAGILKWTSPTEINKFLYHVMTVITTNYVPTTRDIHIYCDGPAGVNFTINLPAPNTVPGKEYYIKKNDKNYTVWIHSFWGATQYDIDGEIDDEITLNQDWEACLLVSSGTQWYIMTWYGNP
ncbi:MAG: hypothetical protein V1779_16310 [bacterium]